MSNRIVAVVLCIISSYTAMSINCEDNAKRFQGYKCLERVPCVIKDKVTQCKVNKDGKDYFLRIERLVYGHETEAKILDDLKKKGVTCVTDIYERKIEKDFEYSIVEFHKVPLTPTDEVSWIKAIKGIAQCIKTLLDNKVYVRMPNPESVFMDCGTPKLDRFSTQFYQGAEDPKSANSLMFVAPQKQEKTTQARPWDTKDYVWTLGFYLYAFYPKALKKLPPAHANVHLLRGILLEPGMRTDFVALIKKCLMLEEEQRPTFDEVVAQLDTLENAKDVPLTTAPQFHSFFHEGDLPQMVQVNGLPLITCAMAIKSMPGYTCVADAALDKADNALNFEVEKEGKKYIMRIAALRKIPPSFFPNLEFFKKGPNACVAPIVYYKAIQQLLFMIIDPTSHESLDRYLAKGKQELPKLANLMKQIGTCMMEINSMQIMLGGISPYSIFVTEDGKIQFAPPPHPTIIDPAPEFWDPHLKNPERFRRKLDIWSLGTVFYYMVFGKVPFEGKNFNDYIDTINTEVVVEIPSDVSEHIYDYFYGSLLDDIEEREHIYQLNQHLTDFIEKGNSKMIAAGTEFSVFYSKASAKKSFIYMIVMIGFVALIVLGIFFRLVAPKKHEAPKPTTPLAP